MINASAGNIRIMNSIEMLSWSLTFFLLSAPSTDPTIGIPYDPYRRGAVSLRRSAARGGALARPERTPPPGPPPPPPSPLPPCPPPHCAPSALATFLLHPPHPSTH